MSLRIAANAAIFVLAVTTVFAQENAPANAPAAGPAAAPQATQPPTPMNRWANSSMGRRQAAGPVNPPSLQKRVEDLQGTVDKMHAALKTMHTKSAANAKDPAVKANLELWDLMVEQLDTQLRELKQAEASRQDMEARRAAMYKQADIKAQAEAKAAQQAMLSQQAKDKDSAQSAGQGSAPAPAASQTPAPSSAPKTSTSPN